MAPYKYVNTLQPSILTLELGLSWAPYSSTYWSTRVLLVIAFHRSSNECPPTLDTTRPVGLSVQCMCTCVGGIVCV